MDNFAIFVMEMKRLLVISYWVVATLLVAIVFTSLGYTFMEAFFIGTLYLPGALAAKYLFTKIVPKDGKSRIRDTVFIVLGILVGEIVLFLMAFYYIELSRNGEYSMWISEMPSIPLIFTNPVFIALILTALAMGAHYFESWLDRKHPEYHQVRIRKKARHPSARRDPLCRVQRLRDHRLRDWGQTFQEQDSDLQVGSQPPAAFHQDSPLLSRQQEGRDRHRRRHPLRRQYPTAHFPEI